MSGSWRVTISDTCIGSGSCVGIAPSHFVLGEDNRSRPRHSEMAPDVALLDAAASCPMEAITITDVDTGEVLSVGE